MKPVFKQLAQDIAMHVAAMSPEGIDTLLAQPFIRNDALAVRDRIAEAARALRERVVVARFVRWGTATL